MNSEGLLLAGIPYDDTVDLAWIPRAGGDEQKLVDGEMEHLDTEQVFALNTGIAFTAYKTGNYDSMVMFVGEMEGETSQWQALELNPNCQDYYPVLAHHTGEDVITQFCGKTDLRLIEPAADTFREIDLTPFIQSIKGAVIQIHWGGD